MISSVLTVTQVNKFLKSLIDGENRLQDLFIIGEISNFNNHRTGMYLSLKDEKSVIKGVMFQSNTKRLKFMPKDGMRVIARGRVSVYEPSGQYQLYITDMQPDGVGAVSVAFEQLKAKLGAEGLFDDEFKKPIPSYPKRIGVITSDTGAAIRDILQITARRWPVAEIIMCPTLVQGNDAPPQLIDALFNLNMQKACDVIIIGRGGGSIEDLQAFNDEGVARAIFASEIPVISAVGHETDFTIADFTADLRAPTPSAAAELATPDGYGELTKIQAYNDYFQNESLKYIEYLMQSLEILFTDMKTDVKEKFIDENYKKLNLICNSVYSAALLETERASGRFSALAARLDGLSPLKIMQRGYAVVNKGGTTLHGVSGLKENDIINIKMSDGIVTAKVAEVKGNV